MKGIGMKGKTIRIASRAGRDMERVENRLVHMLKQTYKLTGFIPSFVSSKEEGEGGRRVDKVDATAAPCVKE